jgi:isoleucyl-tRNA synthetase
VLCIARNAPEGNWVKDGDKFIVAQNLRESIAKAARIELEDIRQVSSMELKDIVCAHPLRDAGLGGYQFDAPLLDGDHVTDDAGTGFVHTAPGHGREDFDIWTASTRLLTQRGIDTAIPYTVDEDGAFTRDAPGFTGERVITDKGEKGKANDAVIKALAAAGMMVARGRLRHQYPHSWRSKKPVIFRNTPQWFIHMDKAVAHIEKVAARDEVRPRASSAAAQIEASDVRGLTPASGPPTHGRNQPSPVTLREASLQAIRETEWVPASGENRIRGMIEAKPDWVISRQRAWGVPITVFVKKDTNEVLLDPEVNQRIYDAMTKEGADAWFADDDGARFLSAPTKLAPNGYDPAQYEKVNDVLDVWFDSGSTHTYVLEDAVHFPGLAGFRRIVDGGRDRVMYLEGSDQHRGWFHSSLIESAGTRGRAPFDVVLTHGFTMDEKGQKMSKSVGNVVAPQDVMKTYGADILRLWVAASDYADDQRLGPDILKSFAESYRKMRNTLRWMLGTLAHYDAKHAVAAADMPELERLMLHRLAELDVLIRKAYAEYEYAKVVAALSQFMNTELSAFYFDIRKDALYCEAPSSRKRHAALTCVEHIFRHVTVWLAPILAFTTDEAWLARYPGAANSVHLELFPAIPADWRDDQLDARWERIKRVRSVVTGALEIERAAKRLGSSLEAAPIVHVTDAELAAALKGVDLAEIAITSAIEVRADAAPAGAFTLAEVAGVAVVPRRAEGRKCARSWRVTADVGSDPAYPDLSARDAAAMHEIEGV